MAFFARVMRLAVDYLPEAIVFRLPILLPVIAILIVRRRTTERRILGQCRSSFWRELAETTVMGIAAGLIGTLTLLYLGVTIDTQGFYYILLVALLLMLLDLRYLCLAYAGGLVSLLALATGFPRLHIPGLLSLVAVLHFTESALILVNGDQQALPVYLGSPRGTIGGYLLQQAWPIPLLALTLVAVDGGGRLIHIGQPGWWPLIALHEANSPNIALQLLPAAAALGYTDLSLTSTPRVKAIRTAGFLGVYSVILLALAVASGRSPAFTWAAALFAPCGHEFVLYAARWIELRGEPAFAQTTLGVKILAVFPGSKAADANLQPGQLITRLNGRAIHSRAEFLARLSEANPATITTVSRPGGSARELVLADNAHPLGLLLAPDLDDPAQVSVRSWRFPPRRESLP